MALIPQIQLRGDPAQLPVPAGNQHLRLKMSAHQLIRGWRSCWVVRERPQGTPTDWPIGHVAGMLNPAADGQDLAPAWGMVILPRSCFEPTKSPVKSAPASASHAMALRGTLDCDLGRLPGRIGRSRPCLYGLGWSTAAAPERTTTDLEKPRFS